MGLSQADLGKMSYTEFEAFAQEYQERHRPANEPSAEKLQEMIDRVVRRTRLKRYESG